MATLNKIVVSVTNDLVSDNRVHKVCTTLESMGFTVLLVGRKLAYSVSVKQRGYSTKRMQLVFKKGPLFYAEYNLRLFFLLLFSNYSVLLSNDLDTLTANFLASVIRSKPMVYDSHEFFTEVPELIGRPMVKGIWMWLEKKMVPRVKSAYTVSTSIAECYNKKYGTNFKVVRNFPVAVNKVREKKEPKAIKTVLYQGALNIGRGLQQAILAMHYLDKTKLVIAGDGDIKQELEKLVETENLQKKVEFTGRLPIEELSELTSNADLGLSIEEDLGLNYRYALPNKLFDYIQSHIPVLVTDLPEMKQIVNQYNIGEVAESLEPKKLAAIIKEALFNENKRKVWLENLKGASKELVLENEEKTLKEIFQPFIKLS